MNFSCSFQQTICLLGSIPPPTFIRVNVHEKIHINMKLMFMITFIYLWIFSYGLGCFNICLFPLILFWCSTSQKFKNTFPTYFWNYLFPFFHEYCHTYFTNLPLNYLYLLLLWCHLQASFWFIAYLAFSHFLVG